MPVRPIRLNGLLAQLAAFALGETAPDAEPLVIGERVLEALGAYFAGCADLLRVARRSALLGEESFGVCLCTQRIGLPGECGVIVAGRLAYARNAQLYRINEPIVGD